MLEALGFWLRVNLKSFFIRSTKFVLTVLVKSLARERFGNGKNINCVF